MSQGARSAITLAVLGVGMVLAAAWGWSAATEPLPAKVDTPVCVTQDVAKGDRVFPQDVTVSVYNAGTRDGLAGRVMQALKDQGFAEGDSGNASGTKVASVQIWTSDAKNPAVVLVASHLGKHVDIRKRQGLGAGVTVVVGDDFHQVRKGRSKVAAQADTQICSPPVS